MNHRRLVLPLLAASVFLSACAPNKLVTQALQHPGDLVNAAKVLGKLVDKYGSKLSAISTKGANGLLTPDDFKELVAITEGLKTGKLPAEPGIQKLTVTEHKKASAFGILASTGFGVFDAGTEQDVVGTGGDSPESEVQEDEANPKLEGETPILESSSENPGSSHYGILDVPDAVDLRSQLPPIRNQGHRGTCVLFSTAAYLDYLYANDPNNPIKHASPEFMNWSYNVYIKSSLSKLKPVLWQDLGTQHALYHTILREGGMADVVPDKWPYVPPQQGYISEEECPYQPDLEYDDPNADFQAMAVKRLGQDVVSKIEAHQSFTAQGARFFKLKHDMATFKSVLAAGQPIQTSLPIYGKDWQQVDEDRHYQIPEMDDDKAADKANIGYHSILLVGYKDDASAPGGGWFVLRNSWGDGWGDAGYAYLSYDFMMNYGGFSFAADPYNGPFQATYALTPPAPDSASSGDTCDAASDDSCASMPVVPLDSVQRPNVIVAPD